MASLIDFLASGVRKSDGSANAGGTASFYTPGTLTAATVYTDSDGLFVASQPVTLDSAGAARIYTNGPVRVIINDASSPAVEVLDVARAGTETAAEVDVSNAAFTATNLDTILTAAQTSFGGTDWKYLATSGQTPMTVQSWMNQAFINVKTFGATGDGTTDDGTACQAAIAYASGLTGGGIVYFPAGTYVTSSGLTVGTSMVTLLGVGSRSSVIKNTSATATALTLTSLTGFAVRDLQITHSSTSTGDGISASTCAYGEISGCRVINHRRGIYLSAAVHVSVERGYVDCENAGTGYGVALAGACVNVAIRDNDVHGISGFTAAAGISVDGSGRGIYITGNRVYAADRGILVASTFTGRGVTVVGNYLATAGTYYIDVAPTFGTNVEFFEAGNTGPTLALGYATRDVSETGIWMSANVGRFPGGFRGVQSTGVLTGTGSFTPDLSTGNAFEIDVSGAGTTLTIANPTNATAAKLRGTRLIFKIRNTSNVTAYAFGGEYAANVAAASVLNGYPNYSNGNTNVFEFEYERISSKWRQIGGYWSAT